MKLFTKLSASSLIVLASFSLNASNNFSGLSPATVGDNLNTLNPSLNNTTPTLPVGIQDIKVPATTISDLTSLPTSLNQASVTSFTPDIGAVKKLLPSTDNMTPSYPVKSAAVFPAVPAISTITPASVVSSVPVPLAPLTGSITDPLIAQIPNASADKGMPSLPTTSVPSTDSLVLPGASTPAMPTNLGGLDLPVVSSHN